VAFAATTSEVKDIFLMQAFFDIPGYLKNRKKKLELSFFFFKKNQAGILSVK
jgi:hypothetical protein